MQGAAPLDWVLGRSPSSPPFPPPKAAGQMKWVKALLAYFTSCDEWGCKGPRPLTGF